MLSEVNQTQKDECLKSALIGGSKLQIFRCDGLSTETREVERNQYWGSGWGRNRKIKSGEQKGTSDLLGKIRKGGEGENYRTKRERVK